MPAVFPLSQTSLEPVTLQLAPDGTLYVSAFTSEGGQWILALDPALVQVVGAARAEGERTKSFGPNEHEPNPFVARQGVDKSRVRCGDLFEAHSPGRPIEVHQGEVSGGTDDELPVTSASVGRITATRTKLDDAVPSSPAHGATRQTCPQPCATRDFR